MGKRLMNGADAEFYKPINHIRDPYVMWYISE